MTPKEKANDILDEFWLLDKVKPMLTEKQAKQCALIAVDEILNHHSQEQGLYRIDTYYWQEVKIELKKL